MATAFSQPVMHTHRTAHTHTEQESQAEGIEARAWSTSNLGPGSKLSRPPSALHDTRLLLNLAWLLPQAFVYTVGKIHVISYIWTQESKNPLHNPVLIPVSPPLPLNPTKLEP